MRLIAWNCRGLGNGPAIRGLLELQKEDPDVLFLSETKMECSRLDWLRWKMGMTQMFVKNCEGQSGGLAMFWKKEVQLVVLPFVSKYHIDTEIAEEDGFVWRFTGIYGEPKSDEKEKTWRLLRNLKQQNNKPWLCAGDFNEILHSWEKEGGPPRGQACMDRFKAALENCELRDLGYVGDTFTWRNHSHMAEKYVKERLDRAVATTSWCCRFPAYRVTNGDPRHSDHRPVIVDTAGAARIRHGSVQNQNPRFEASWLEEEGCKEMVQNIWQLETQIAGENVAGAVKSVMRELMDWSRNILGDLEKRICRLKKQLEECRRQNIGAEQVHKEQILRFKLERLEEQRETYWKQRAHINWMKGGDRNTKKFHAAATERRRQNRIKKLRREDGRVVEDVNEMKEVVSNYFLNLFTSHAGTRLDQLLGHIEPRVTSHMNESLAMEFTREEVYEALQSIGDLKAPGLDGMPSIFYKKCWDIVGDEVVAEVLNVLNGGPMPEGWNDTCVVLIPKVKNPESMKDLRPISLCNVVYKLVSKVLANRLKQILPDIISPNQSAFVPGQLITDNILLAYECTHYMKNKRGGKEGYAAVKLDMSKAYDHIEWHFLERMMYKLGFQEQWINKIMLCVSSVSYKFRVNGECTDTIVPQRGLRQGDPISPYLFLICVEGFSSLLNKAEADGSLKGIRICNNAPSFNHLLFADDS
uniref:Reverse transcriptase domain-containing protein n=1 Tax=Triticum urartu TaxID=4572 RepID=A0A8R7QRC4_TRIUA